ncbi:protein kinase domain-containing protein [Polyangium sorediatum]|uniref:Serine/threonine-protein kinase n=1 Tax=Polyangium sorediatum TaxID=889274 RepID=A0ABT6P7P0_9BACT|nr:serine/threonine-protein kinase [Polyangium sorediatum]MDI1436576.1 serine/threonine-protein kinase [Polyangium sorediatum]
MACLDENLLFELSVGQLDGAALAKAEEHLDTCPRCRRVVAAALRASGAAAPAPPALVQRGTAIGRYLVVERVGVGAMGQVFAAYDPELDRKVALKLLRFSSRPFAEEEQRRARLAREAQTLARLSHPNVVTVFDVGTWEQQAFIALEFVPGGSARVWATREPRAWREIVRLWIQVGRGLAAAHAAGVVHRDLKPDNVLVRADGRAQVTDFGLAAETTLRDEAAAPTALALTETGALLGTPVYMAPDQLEGAPATEASDQFAFCVSLWEALYGERPFVGQTLAELAQAVREQAPRAPASSPVPPAVRRLLQGGLHPDPRERHASVTTLVDALERAIEKPRRFGLPVLIGAALLTLGVVLVARPNEAVRRHPTCVLAEERHRAAWDEARRGVVREGFDRTGLSYAAQAFGVVDGAVSARASAWRAERAEACEALVDAATPDPLFRARVACLDERLAELDAATSVLSLGGADAVNRATSVVERMAPLDACVAARAGPADAEPCEACVAIRADVQRGKTLLQLGKFAEAERVTKNALGREAPPNAVAARAALLVEHARTLEPLGRLDEAEREMFDAALAAHRIGSRVLAAEAFAELAYYVGYLHARPDDGERWALQADALLGPDDAPILDRVAMVRGVIETRRGNLRLAEEHFRRVEESVRKRLGAAHPSRARVLTNLASTILHQGRFDDALPLLKESYDLFVAALGADHPDAFQALNAYGVALGNAGRFTEAVPVFEAALAGYKRTLGANHPRIGRAASNLAEALYRLKRYPDARVRYLESAAAFERALGADAPDRALALTGLGQVYIAEGACAEGLAETQRALAICAKSACEPGEAAALEFLHAKAWVCAGHAKAQVLPHARRAVELFRSLGARTEAQIAEIEAWLR